jgi:hypothetical protein
MFCISKGYVLGKFDNIKKVKNSASMQEVVTATKTDKKKKIISLPVDWEEKIKSVYPGTVSSYILMAIQEKMKKENIL